MTEQEEIAKLEKQLEVCHEEIRTHNQIKETFVEFCSVLAQLSIAYVVFTLAIIGAQSIYIWYWGRLVSVLLFAVFVLWICWGMRFTCYQPIWDDGIEGLNQIIEKSKGAIEGWRKS